MPANFCRAPLSPIHLHITLIHHAMKHLLSTATLAAAILGLTCCDSKPAGAGSSAPQPAGNQAGAKELLSAFVKPGADLKALSAALKPDTADYKAVFAGDFAAKVQAAHATLWASNPELGPKEGQTEVLLDGVTSTDIKSWSANAADVLPGGYQGIKDKFNDDLIVYRFKFVKPGEQTGMAFDGLVHVNGKWRIFPKPWRAAE